MNEAFAAHPVSMVPQWLDALGGGEWIASFSRYRYVPQTVEDRRERFRVPLRHVTPNWLEAQLATLPSGSELALDSVLRSGRREMHIPMVDFAADALRQVEVVAWAADHLQLSLQLFASGRSYHAYGTQPISRSKWIRLMGLLLLANLPDQPPLVDARWIGHRLLAGYASLRWSRNSPHYLSVPSAFASTWSPS